MFSFREFIRRGFLNAVGKLADYQIILNAAGWYDKGVLLEEDLSEINARLSDDAASDDAASGGAASDGDTSGGAASDGDTSGDA